MCVKCAQHKQWRCGEGGSVRVDMYRYRNSLRNPPRQKKLYRIVALYSVAGSHSHKHICDTFYTLRYIPFNVWETKEKPFLEIIHPESKILYALVYMYGTCVSVKQCATGILCIAHSRRTYVWQKFSLDLSGYFFFFGWGWFFFRTYSYT